MGDLPYAESFRELLVYQRARQLSREIFQITKAFRLFGISQGKATYSGTPIRQIGDSPQGQDKGVGTEL